MSVRLIDNLLSLVKVITTFSSRLLILLKLALIPNVSSVQLIANDSYKLPIKLSKSNSLTLISNLTRISLISSIVKLKFKPS